jgi:hypothetical protein
MEVHVKCVEVGISPRFSFLNPQTYFGTLELWRLTPMFSVSTHYFEAYHANLPAVKTSRESIKLTMHDGANLVYER